MDVYRSLLFIPGNKPKWLKNIPSYDVDAVILDLEDSVPNDEKKQARKNIQDTIFSYGDGEIKLFARINKISKNYDLLDLKSVVCKGLHGVVLPKVETNEEIEVISSLIEEIEMEKDLKIGSVKILPILETAKSMYFAYDIALCNRVIGITGLSSKNGDVERALGTKWTPEGLETLYLKSKVVMAARAANVIPIGGLWQDVHNYDGLRKSALFNRQLGYDGELILHPGNAGIINEVYSPSFKEVEYYSGLIKAFEKAKKQGMASVMYEGSHIDYAHVKTAKSILKIADQINKKN